MREEQVPPTCVWRYGLFIYRCCIHTSLRSVTRRIPFSCTAQRTENGRSATQRKRRGVRKSGHGGDGDGDGREAPVSQACATCSCRTGSLSRQSKAVWTDGSGWPRAGSPENSAGRARACMRTGACGLDGRRQNEMAWPSLVVVMMRHASVAEHSSTPKHRHRRLNSAARDRRLPARFSSGM